MTNDFGSSLLIQVVTLTFDEFSTESNYDFVRLYDGCNATSASLGSLTGPLLSSRSFTTSQRCMYVTFTSDGSVTSTGFYAAYTTTGGTITYGTITNSVIFNAIATTGAATNIEAANGV